MAQRGTVVVTGASSGIGEATALRLDRSGWQVVAGVRKPADGDALRGKASGLLEVVLLDVTDAASIAAAAEQLAGRPLAGLVNNAGVALGGPLEHLPIDTLRQQLEVNVIGLMAVTQALLPGLRLATGRIVNMGSVGGRVASPFVGPYNASKFAVESLTDSLRQELRPWGLQVTVIEPGAVSTPIWGKGASSAADLGSALPAIARERYGTALAAFTKLTARLDRKGISPEVVAEVVERALTADRPRTRYLVGRDAHLQVIAKALLPDRVLDRAIARLTGL